jgi:hypothetical protein
MNDNTKIVDGFRFVASLNTMVRNLSIVSKIIEIIGTKQLPKQFLKSALVEWSSHAENKSSKYKNHRGKITDHGKPTTAFPHYLDFTACLGLITCHGDLLMLSRLGLLLNKLLDEPKQIESQLTEEEKLFYLIILFRNDADALLLTIQLLNQYSDLVAQQRLFEQFESKLKKRLLTKLKYANELSQSIIREKYRVVEFEWKKAESYAKHIIPPRLEWMADLGILNRIKRGSKIFYKSSRQGNELYKSFISLPDSDLCDINENWLRTKAMNSLTPVICNNVPLKKWSELTTAKRMALLKPYLSLVFNYFNFDGAMRISLHQAFLYIIINFAIIKDIVVEFNDLEKEFKESIIVGKRRYSIRSAARINEGYISVNLI